MAANVVRGKLAALFLGAAGVGVFNQLSLMWNMFQIGGSLGAFNGLVQHGTEAMVSKDEAALHRLASTWWILLSAFSCMLVAAGAIGSPILSDWLLGDRGAHAGLVALMLLSIPFAVTAQVYRALLSAARLIPQLVRAQIVSDAGGALLFAGLVPALGLPGAILGFSAIHFLFYIYTFVAVRKILGARYTRPRPSEFRWTVVRSNIGFGAIALTTILLSNLSIILVSRFLIGHHGIEASGIFSNAWRIASVYLGAVTATAISYYLPTLTRAESVEQMGQHFNAAIRFYLYVLPPIMAVIMASGEPIVWLILSREFLPVAPLLLAFVPAELFRVLAETINVPLYSRRRLAAFLIPYCLQAVVFVFGAYAAIPRFGMIGAAVAYGVGTSLAALVNVIACRIHLGIGPDRHSLTAFGRALALLSAVILISLRWPFGLERLALTAVVTTLWACLTVLDPKAKAPLLATLNSAVRRTQ